MPQQTELRFFKRVGLHSEKNQINSDDIKQTRGLYVLYDNINDNFNVKYIGIGGTGNTQKTGVFARLKNHKKK